MSSPQGQLPATKDIVTRVFGDVKEYSKLVGQIPSDDYEYHQAFPGFRKQVSEQSATLIRLMDTCTRLLPKRRRVSLGGGDSTASGGPHAQLSDTQRTAVMESIDSLLENVDTVLDDLRGRKMRSADQLSVTFGSELSAGAPGSAEAGSTDGVVRVAHVLRPQLTFETPVDNSDAPFVPVYYDAQGKKHTGVAGQHPFAETIEKAVLPADQLLPKAETPAVPLQTCPLTFIDTPEDLARVVSDELLHVTEIAVDLEHHDFYSYQGFTCLMQISSRTTDYIVDCLKLRSSMHLLAPVFLNGSILKVFHGAREDVRWLQKDFGLYLVNFFDTGIALQTLHMPYSLAFAVDHFCQVKLNKKYQTADWRVRPLPAEMVHYARQDTHYLLYVYDRLKALLLNSENRASVGNLLQHVYNESRRLSLELYEKPRLYPEESYRAALGRSLGGLSAVQERVAKEVFNWRDAAAREADDSPTAVLHLSSVLAIASKLPTSATELLRCCSPVSVVLRKGVGHLVDLIKAALGDSAQAAAAVGDGTLENTEGVGSGEQTVASAEMAVLRARKLGVYRPMTGALPSFSSRVAPATVPTTLSSASGSYHLTQTTPSVWCQAMRHLSASIAARPRPHVPLPGSELLATMQANMQKRLADAKALAEEKDKATAGEEEEQARKRSRNEDTSQDDEEPEGPAKAAAGDSVVPKAEENMMFPEGAFSLRQEFGTGAQDRKKSKASAAKKSKGKKK